MDSRGSEGELRLGWWLGEAAWEWKRRRNKERSGCRVPHRGSSHVAPKWCLSCASKNIIFSKLGLGNYTLGLGGPHPHTPSFPLFPFVSSSIPLYKAILSLLPLLNLKEQRLKGGAALSISLASSIFFFARYSAIGVCNLRQRRYTQLKPVSHSSVITSPTKPSTLDLPRRPCE